MGLVPFTLDKFISMHWKAFREGAVIRDKSSQCSFPRIVFTSCIAIFPIALIHGQELITLHDFYFDLRTLVITMRTSSKHVTELKLLSISRSSNSSMQQMQGAVVVMINEHVIVEL